MEVLTKHLPAATSKAGELNHIDWKRIQRVCFVAGASAAITLLSSAAGMTYKYKGVNYTPIVMLAINAALETLRAYKAGATSK